MNEKKIYVKVWKIFIPDERHSFGKDLTENKIQQNKLRNRKMVAHSPAGLVTVFATTAIVLHLVSFEAAEGTSIAGQANKPSSRMSPFEINYGLWPSADFSPQQQQSSGEGQRARNSGETAEEVSDNRRISSEDEEERGPPRGTFF